MVAHAITALIRYACDRELITPGETEWATNALLQVLELDEVPPASGEETGEPELVQILDILMDDARLRGLLPENSVTHRDLLDTKLMGALTPRPAQVRQRFFNLYAQSPARATDWYYRFSQDTNYIRRDRMKKDLRWQVHTEYGFWDITINLAKPEKDPDEIARALKMPASGYPPCLLCASNEGYAGRLNHPARQNHRIIPLTLNGEAWYLQYSPYVYYNEHCILLNRTHTPMKIDTRCFAKLLDFVRQFPHYVVGSNADLPIVGGSILSHDHFQGGRYSFAMQSATVETPFTFPGYEDISAGIVKWPLSVIRLTAPDPGRLTQLATVILDHWRGYSDPDAFIFAHTGGEAHNTITPIARRRDALYELDLVLRNNITTEQYPMGVFHPHQELHHIKRENIGLIEVMGLAVLPARLKKEMEHLGELLVRGGDPERFEDTAKHAQWARELRRRHQFTEDNVYGILQQEIGVVFTRVLEHAGVYKRTPEGQEGFVRFLSSVR